MTERWKRSKMTTRCTRHAKVNKHIEQAHGAVSVRRLFRRSSSLSVRDGVCADRLPGGGRGGSRAWVGGVRTLALADVVGLTGRGGGGGG